MMTNQDHGFLTPQASARAARIRTFLQRHGASLATLVAVIDDVFITHAMETAQALANATSADCAEHVEAQLREVLEALECVSFDKLRRCARDFDGPELEAAVNWHGARLSTLLS
ncbi:hypothetical protein V6Z72_21390 [Cereibacter sphaeroides]|uniref:hypothetical protein n=1 Tax=Cereibacter sphaeroides TaxID=1063 RepID=UPI0039909051